MQPYSRRTTDQLPSMLRKVKPTRGAQDKGNELSMLLSEVGAESFMDQKTKRRTARRAKAQSGLRRSSRFSGGAVFGFGRRYTFPVLFLINLSEEGIRNETGADTQQAFGVWHLFSALIVGIMLTIGQVLSRSANR